MRLLAAILTSLALVVWAAATASADVPLGRLADPALVDEPAVPPWPSGRSPAAYAGCRPRRPAVPPPPGEARGVDPGSPNPLAGGRFFVDPEEPAYRSWKFLRARGRSGKAALLWRIAREPRFRWFGAFTRPNMARRIRQYLARARCLQPGSVPLMTVMRHQGAECHRRYLAGGARADRAQRRWYRKFARAIGGRRVVIGFEPDSTGTIGCLARSRRAARISTLAYGVRVLSRLPQATVYIEAGASDWEAPGTVARKLRRLGIHRVRGFMLNVTHLDWTAANVRYGLAVSRRVGGKPFVINTATNGRGPVHYNRRPGRASRRINVWCNPGYRGLGPPPTTLTSHPKVDAYLWISRPGYGQSCSGGSAGAWWLARALMYARYATAWESPPAGTRHGHFERLSDRQLGIRR